MKKVLFIIISIFSFFILYNSSYSNRTYFLLKDDNILESDEYKEIDSLLSQWCDEYHLVKPDLKMRFNRKNEAYYQNNSIMILITKDDFLNNKKIPYLKVMLAHEFGHHFLMIKNSDSLFPYEEEKRADLIALKLVGFEDMKNVFENEIKSNNYDLSFKTRLRYLKEVNNGSIQKSFSF